MNVTQLYAEIGQLLNDPLNQRWTPSILLPRINTAQIKVLSLTKSKKAADIRTVVEGTSGIPLISGTMDVLRVLIKNSAGDWKKLDGISENELDFEFPNWRNMESGEPTHYYWQGTDQQVNLIPPPNSEWAQTDGLKAWIIQKPTDLDDASDIPFGENAAMVPYHMSIVHWVVAQCWMDDGTPESLAKSKFHKSGSLERPGEFEKEIMLIRQDFDVPTDIPARVLWKPQGGRLGRGFGRPSKSSFV